MKISSQFKIVSVLLFFFVSVYCLFAEVPPAQPGPQFLMLTNDQWVNEKIGQMTLEEKIAQLMMVTVYPRQSESAKNSMISVIEKFRPGGILVMQGTPVKTARWINEFQEKSTVPLFVAIDGEWGISMRMDSTIKYPYAQALGAIKDSTFIYQMGRDFAQQMKMMGIQMNFAPVADVSTNPQNPVINFRSFGEDKVNVSQKAWWVAEGMQDGGVIPVAKHFPGHGDSETDSHHELPLINHSKERIDLVESFPFRFLTESGIAGIMSAHLNVPALDNSGTPSSLSTKIIDGYLRKEIGFKGLVITDAINMKGVRTDRGNAELEALKAGNDMVEFVPDIGKAIASVKQALSSGEITLEEIENKCRRVLAAKRWVGLHIYEPANTKNLTARLNSPYFEVTNRKLIKSALTVLVNQNVLPVEDLVNLKIASVTLGSQKLAAFENMLDKYADVDHFFLSKNATAREMADLRKRLDNYNLVIAGVQGINLYPSGKYGTSEMQRNALADFIRDNNVITVFFGNAYALKHFENVHHAKGLIVAYQNNQLTQELAAQLVFGAFDASGKLPVTVDKRFPCGVGLSVTGNKTFAYSIPEEVGMDSKMLASRIDSLAILGIENSAYPGCQVLIAKDGNVVFHKCYGFHTYKQEQKVLPGNLYDWASLTKVTGPLPALMKLVDEKKIDLDAPFSNYWPAFNGTERGKLPVRDFLTHQARLPAWIPFWRMGLDEEGKLSREVFSDHPSAGFSVRVSEHLYLNNNFKQAILDTIKNAKSLPVKKYVYSDLGFHLYPDIIANLTNVPYEEFIKQNIHGPLGAYSTTYKPYLHFPLDNIIPTETDDFFRNEKLRGFVHDEGAAMLGGVSGNAGLFGTANDLAKIFQMYLQKGYFGGKRFISEKTMNEFIRRQFPDSNNRRALGFDKPLVNNHRNKLKDAYPAVDASKNSFGHTGYTGTMAWADPDNGTLFIFLSNRVHPTRDNLQLFNLNIRTAMHQSIYDCLAHFPR
ncbi:beta-glucosidase [Mariniphaga anaerophila]|uniref:beta-N-acetylhexosaminidase n=1 Tax=Mariniphaga anaerophila TaxID=1484053 RepID=A0A1M5DMU5_9BACT|nr:glycoside hydrolase family 3 N-terminal domain-containing protein [Mariniphaga anaerophila]SHF68348.1 beta-glucosidase [Mariniphaga anaerophila]